MGCSQKHDIAYSMLGLLTKKLSEMNKNKESVNIVPGEQIDIASDTEMSVPDEDVEGTIAAPLTKKIGEKKTKRQLISFLKNRGPSQ